MKRQAQGGLGDNLIVNLEHNLKHNIKINLKDNLKMCWKHTHLVLPISRSLAWPPSHSHILSASLRNKLAFPECTRTNPPQGAVQMPRKITPRCLAVFLCYLDGNLVGTRSTSDCGFFSCAIFKTRQTGQFGLYFLGSLKQCMGVLNSRKVFGSLHRTFSGMVSVKCFCGRGMNMKI